MSFLRRHWVLIVGLVVVGVGVLMAVLSVPSSGLYAGWTAYAPLTSTTFVPGYTVIGGPIGDLLILIGAVLVAGWVGFRIGRLGESRP